MDLHFLSKLHIVELVSLQVVVRTHEFLNKWEICFLSGKREKRIRPWRDASTLFLRTKEPMPPCHLPCINVPIHNEHKTL